MKYSKVDLGKIEAVWNKLGGEAGADAFLAGKLIVADPQSLTKVKAEPGSILRVDRSVRPQYPDWVDKVMHPELENTGPKRFDLGRVRDNLWLHDGQKNGGRVTGQVIYDYLKSTDTLKTCLGLRDGEEIRKKGIKTFRKYFGGKAVFLWKSIVRNRSGSLSVPYLFEYVGQVVVYWNWLDFGWFDTNPAARFAS